jgi:iron complex outermembrane receptor protein
VNIGEGTGQANIAIRGIGFATLNPGDEGRVAYYVDSNYVPRPSAQLASFYDVERVEVLRGPQGTLYGRNATAGAMNVITRDPTDVPSAYLNITAGTYRLGQLEGALSGPVVDSLTGRVAFQVTSRGGYGKNLFTGKSIDDERAASFRTKLLWKPIDSLDVGLSADYHSEHDRAEAFHPFGPGLATIPLLPIQISHPILFNSRDLNSYFDPTNDRESYGINSHVTYRVADSVSVRLLSGYQHSDYYDARSADASPLPLLYSTQGETSNSYSTELQLLGDQPFVKWVVGAYYFKEKDTPFNIAPRDPINNGIGQINFVNGIPVYNLKQGGGTIATLKTSAPSLYGEASFRVTEAFHIVLGGRYSWEHKDDIDDIRFLDVVTPYPPSIPPANLAPSKGFPRNGAVSFSKFTPKVGLNYQVTPDVFAYATWSRGFKSGGFNYGAIQAAYLPEDLKSYEVGLKSEFLQKRLRANLSLYKYDYTNMQTSVAVPSPPSVTVLNAGRSTLKGAELELTVLPLPQWQLDGFVAYSHARFTNFITADTFQLNLGLLNLAGNHLPYAPDVTGHIGTSYSWHLTHGSIRARVEGTYTAKTYFEVYNRPSAIQPGYATANAFLTWQSENEDSTVTLAGRNLADRFIKNSTFINGPAVGAVAVGQLAPPRTVDITFSRKF